MMRRNLTYALLALGVATLTLSACGNKSESKHNAADVAFAEHMIPHHEQAVEMSTLATTATQRPEVRSLAERIKNAQDPEIRQMESWLSEWAKTKEHANHESAHTPTNMAGMLDSETMSRLRSAKDVTFDRQYLEGMIAHHRGAVDMAQQVLRDGESTDVRKLATNIIDTQNTEIAEMQKLLGP